MRAIEPEHHEEEGRIKPAAFLDMKYQDQPRGMRLSLYALGPARPADLLQAVSCRSSAKKACGTYPKEPSPSQMYDLAHYRVAILEASVIVEIIKKSNEDIFFEITDEDGIRYNENGHLNLVNGRKLAPLWADRFRILSRDETLSVECDQLSLGRIKPE